MRDCLDPILSNKTCIVTCSTRQNDYITYLLEYNIGIFAKYVVSGLDIFNRSLDTYRLFINFLEHVMFKLTERCTVF